MAHSIIIIRIVKQKPAADPWGTTPFNKLLRKWKLISNRGYLNRIQDDIFSNGNINGRNKPSRRDSPIIVARRRACKEIAGARNCAGGPARALYLAFRAEPFERVSVHIDEIDREHRCTTRRCSECACANGLMELSIEVFMRLLGHWR
ncbi:hypothetical protein JTB14_028288 [Gonioctena quinquepunctata]|nr:hypothetical protein JTB14_028288 [Gonioctena quinquepunctata]